MSRYYTSSLFVFSVIVGVLAYTLLSFFASNEDAMLFASIATLAIATTVPAVLAFADRKLISLKNKITEPISVDERVGVISENGIRQGFIITTAKSLYIITLDGTEPVCREIKKEDVKKISVSDGVYLNIFVDYNKFIRVFPGNCEELFSMLAEEGFTK